MKSHIIVDNIRCNGCATTIRKHLESKTSAADIDFEIETGKVSFTCPNDDCRLKVASELKKIGYPLAGKGSKVDVAKSVISCVKGKVSNLNK